VISIKIIYSRAILSPILGTLLYLFQQPETLPPFLPVSAAVFGHKEAFACGGKDFTAVEGQVLKAAVGGISRMADNPVSTVIS
jgi:hypothetical protein